VAFHGTISELRTQAPDPGHLLSTSDDDRAVGIARDRHPGLTVGRDPEGGLTVAGPQDQLSAYVADLVRSGVDLLAFTPTETPLEALFFMLTDTHSDSPAPRHRIRHPEQAGAPR
jgi:ABC-2 type transport system ATP-binding protein